MPPAGVFLHTTYSARAWVSTRTLGSEQTLQESLSKNLNEKKLGTETCKGCWEEESFWMLQVYIVLFVRNPFGLPSWELKKTSHPKALLSRWFSELPMVGYVRFLEGNYNIQKSAHTYFFLACQGSAPRIWFFATFFLLTESREKRPFRTFQSFEKSF